ncbi:hypothetical protein H0H92_004612 [Tricholoma furcatifolium]|nr:hypothetical protein H0H92_004612 [Tricholoma furcatifolium]
MDDHHELSALADALFDDWGSLKKHVLESGTGCWGMELNDGNIIFILNTNVNRQYRGQGVGTSLLKALLFSKYVKQPADVLMCWPEPLRQRNMTREAFHLAQAQQIKFFRKNGFRRIGRTDFFGFSVNPNHPSHAIRAELDADAQESECNTRADKDFSPQELALKYPLHSAIMNKQGKDVQLAINGNCAVDPSCLHQRDASGLTPIHAAFDRENPSAVAALLAQGAVSDMDDCQNSRGMTPLEILTNEMQSSRNMQMSLLGLFHGYTHDQLVCEFLGRRALKLPTHTENMAEYVKQRNTGRITF